MFDKQYRFVGKHADMVTQLAGAFDEESKAQLFARNLDVYINAPIIGFLFKKKADVDKSNDNVANIFPEQMLKASEELKYVFRLIMLLDEEYEPDSQKRLDKAFRHLGEDESDLALFDSYVRGGVEVLHGKLIAGVGGEATEYTNRLYDFVEEFNNRFNSDISNDQILELCQEANQ